MGHVETEQARILTPAQVAALDRALAAHLSRTELGARALRLQRARIRAAAGSLHERNVGAVVALAQARSDLEEALHRAYGSPERRRGQRRQAGERRREGQG